MSSLFTFAVCHLVFTAHSAAALFRCQGNEAPKIHLCSLLKKYAQLQKTPQEEHIEEARQVQPKKEKNKHAKMFIDMNNNLAIFLITLYDISLSAGAVSTGCT